MASSADTHSTSPRSRLSEGIRRFRRRFQRSSSASRIVSTQTITPVLDPVPDADSRSPSREDDTSKDSTYNGNDDPHVRTRHGYTVTNRATRPHNQDASERSANNAVIATDLWSAAYGEAVESLGDDIDTAILLGSSAGQLFKELEKMDKDSSQQSTFLRGVAYLRSIQVPLERFKLALDLVAPLGSLDPAASTAIGVVRSVTAIAISFATADLEFAKQIGEMLEQISYIDGCDTLGQRLNKTDIHKALVRVYRKILEFYKTAHEILTQRGRKLAMKMILETDRLPTIVQDFLRHADTLRKLIEISTQEVVADIQSMVYDLEISRWLDSSKMDEQVRYHNSLKELRSDGACEFLCAQPAFERWYQTLNCQQLLIVGEMGCGKTVAMSYLVDELNKRTAHQIPRWKVCYHYCRNDETGKDTSILCGLILALLEQLHGLKKTFHNWYKAEQLTGDPSPASSGRKLGKFLESILTTFDRKLFLIIDGLDECDTASRSTLLKVLGDLLQGAPQLRIALSSRPEEAVLRQLDHSTKIQMNIDRFRDEIIVQHTVREQLSHLSEDVRHLVIERLTNLAQGSAIWIKMTIKLIEVRNISALAPMRRFLQEARLPEQLSLLYSTLLIRNSFDDVENKKLATLALKLLAAACRPLSIRELSWAAELAMAGSEVKTVAALAQLVDCHRVVGLIQPFIGSVDFTDPDKLQVRLVHQSVKEFIANDLTKTNGVVEPRRTPIVQDVRQTEDLEAFMLDVCINYLLLEEIGTVPLFSEEQIAIAELPQDVDLFGDRKSFEYNVDCTWEEWEKNMIRYDPIDRGFGGFFVYASSYWLKHFGAIGSGPIPQLTKVETLCQAGSMRLQNWIDQHCRPGCAIKARFNFDSHLYDPLSITSLYGSSASLLDMLLNSTFTDGMYLTRTATCAADQILQWGDLAKLKSIFLESELGRQLHSLKFFQLILQRWSEYGTRHEDWTLAFDLVRHVHDRLTKEQWGHDLICAAARVGCVPMIECVLNEAQGKAVVATKLCRSSQPVVQAILGNHVDAVEFLLAQKSLEPHLQNLSSQGESLLHVASVHCNPSVISLLLPHLNGAIHQVDSHGDTALTRIIRSTSAPQSRYGSVRAILEFCDADWTIYRVDGQPDPLELAVELGDVEMCRMLVREGRMNAMSVLTRDHDGTVITKSKPAVNEEIIIQLLEQHIV